MRRYILAFTLLLASCSLFAACGVSTTIGDGIVSSFSGLSATPANVTAYMWQPGSGVFNSDTVGIDSDGVLSVEAAGCPWDQTGVLVNGQECNGDPAGYYWIDGDWLTAAYDGCPSAGAGIRLAIIAWDNTGNYSMQNKIRSESFGVWDNGIGTVAVAALTGGQPTIALSGDEAANQVDVTWTAFPALALQGTHGASLPGTIPTSFRYYFYQGVALPANFATSAWTAGVPGTLAIATPSSLNLPIPAPIAGQYTCVSRSLIYDGLEMPFVSNSYRILTNPSGAPVIANISAANNGIYTNVTWTSTDESQVTGYQVFWAPIGGEYTEVGNRIDPAGNDHDYTSSVRIPAAAGFNVKVGAYLTSGEVEYSAVANVKASNVIKNKTRVNVN
jgi:hypothetical protein